jgi:aspartyl-tRNA(Asn)/glutamyl-tRNA(Gln) amidotransferase subunit B
VRLGALLDAVAAGAISPRDGKRVIDAVIAEDKDPADIIKEKGMVQVSDSSVLEEAVKKVIAANPDAAARFKAGETKLTGFFVGQAVKLTQGKGNPKEISALVVKLLG